MRHPTIAQSIADPFPRIPSELKARRAWVVWASGKKKNKQGKYAKIPHNPRTGKPASTTNPATWSTYAEACAAYASSRWAGLGYVFTADDPYTGADFDKCISAGTVAPGVAAIVAEVRTYTEVSPSGEGVKLIVRGTLPAALKRDAIELYDRGRFFALTGNALQSAPSEIAEGQALIDRLYAAFGGTARDTKRQRRDNGTAPSSDLLDWSFIAWLEQHTYRLIDRNGIPYGAGPHLKHLLTTDELPAPVRVKGDTPSERRAVVAAGLVGHMPEERYVILRATWRRFDYESGKTERDLRADALRLIFEIYPVKASAYAPASLGRFSDYRKAVKDGTAPQAQPPTEEPPHKRGRKRSKIDAAGYLRWLLDAATSEYKVLGRRRENAEQLGCSVAHIDRLEATLRDAGAAERHTTKSRRDSWLELNHTAADAFLGAIRIAAQPSINADSVVLSSAAVCRTVAPDVASAPDEGRTRLCALATPPPEPQRASAEPEPAAPPAAEPHATRRVLPSTPPAGGCPTLAEVIAEAVEAYGPKIKPARRHAAMYGYDDAGAVRLAYSRHIWALERAKVRAMDDAELVDACKGRRKALARNIGKPREGYHRTRHSIADDERRRRGLNGPGATLKTPALLAMMETEAERDATERASRRRAVANHQRAERQDVRAVVELGATPRPAERRADAQSEAWEGDDTTPTPQRAAECAVDFAEVARGLLAVRSHEYRRTAQAIGLAV